MGCMVFQGIGNPYTIVTETSLTNPISSLNLNRYLS